MRFRTDGEVHAAIWLHDIVYDPQAHDNEERSAEQALHDLAGSSIDAREVARIILDTKRHEGGDPMLDMFCDMDLGILSAGPAHYDAYAAQIRAEYAHVEDHAYRIGRADILRRFNQRRIYKTTAFAGREHLAHANLEREIASLTD